MNNDSTLEFLGLIGHDVRWQLLSLLAQSDFRVHELVEKIDRPLNVVSYHLSKLRQYELVTERRSSADGRDIYYSLDLDRTSLLYRQAGQQLHPSLGRDPHAQGLQDRRTGDPQRVLFLCTRNSARSQMAEGLLRKMGGHSVRAFSAGDRPSAVHPFAIRAMAEIGVDISGQHAKHKDIFDGQPFGYVITVCDFARENCPTYSNDPTHIHWSIPDPVENSVDDAAPSATYAVFISTAQNIRGRVRHLLARITSTTGADFGEAAHVGVHPQRTSL